MFANLNTPFHFAGKFHALKATKFLILSKLLMNTIESKEISLEEAKTILDRIISAEPPPNQNTSTIWTYHISSVDELWNAMNEQQRSNLEEYNSDYLDKLLPLRNE